MQNYPGIPGINPPPAHTGMPGIQGYPLPGFPTLPHPPAGLLGGPPPPPNMMPNFTPSMHHFSILLSDFFSSRESEVSPLLLFKMPLLDSIDITFDPDLYPLFIFSQFD